MGHHYKLLVVDVDGTLLGRKGTISAENKKALAQAREAGILVSLSTGRAMQGCLSIINQLSLDGYHIFFDGALVAEPSTGEEVYFSSISRALVKEMVDFVHQQEINLELYSATHYFVEKESWSSDIRYQYFELQPTIVDFAQVWQKERVLKGTLVVLSAEEKAKAEKFRLHFAHRLTFTKTKTPAYPEVDFINILAPGVSKKRALAILAHRLDVSLEEVMAIGDGANDVSLLSSVGLAVAMGNAVEELKAVAHYITLDVEQGGVATAVKRFLLS